MILGNKSFYFFLKLIIFLSTITYLIYYLDFQLIIAELDFYYYIKNYHYIIFFILISLLINLLNIFRFSRIIESLYPKKIPFLQSSQIITYSNLASEIGNIFFFISRYFLSKKINFDLKKNFIIVFVEKILSLSIYIIYFFIFLCTLNTKFIFGMIFLILLTIFISQKKFIINYLHRIKKKTEIFLYTLFAQSLVIIQLFICTKLIGISLNYYEIFFLIPFLIFLSSFSPTFTDWGYREFVFVLVLDYFNYLNEEAFILSISFGLLSLFSSFLLVIFLEIYFVFFKNKSEAS